MNLIKTQSPDFSRDEQNNTLINTNVAAFKLYKQQRDSRMSIDNSNKEIAELKNEIADLKSLITKILEEKNG